MIKQNRNRRGIRTVITRLESTFSVFQETQKIISVRFIILSPGTLKYLENKVLLECPKECLDGCVLLFWFCTCSIDGRIL